MQQQEGQLHWLVCWLFDLTCLLLGASHVALTNPTLYVNLDVFLYLLKDKLSVPKLPGLVTTAETDTP